MARSLATSSPPGALTDLGTRSLQHPHTLIAFVAAILCLAVATLPGMVLTLNRSQERRLYWGGVGAAAVFAGIAVLPDWKLSIGVAAFGLALMTAGAYMTSAHIKIRGKIYAYHLADSQPDPSPTDAETPLHERSNATVEDRAPDSYGGITTAAKSWWNLLGVMAFLDFGVLAPHPGSPWMRPVAIGVLVLIAAVFGYGDGSWGYPVARGQRRQFVIIAIITAAAHTVVYLLSYRAGRRWPYRSTRSMEYRAHPRFQPPEGRHGRGAPPPS